MLAYFSEQISDMKLPCDDRDSRGVAKAQGVEHLLQLQNLCNDNPVEIEDGECVCNKDTGIKAR